MRAEPLLKLLHSVQLQSIYPSEIIIVDGSTNYRTKEMLDNNDFENLSYFLVSAENRGLTKQRNFGVSKVSQSSEIVCFLDDDTILHKDYFKNLLTTYEVFPEADGVGGYITNETTWQKVENEKEIKSNEFYFDGYKRTDASRFVLRKKLGLDADKPPGFLPEFSHGRSIGFLPPSGKIYEVEQLMGGVSSFKKEIFLDFQFSHYFEGYSLYEDADFTLRLSKKGKIFVNTNAQLEHYHDHSGRPNKYVYGKMVVRNGWYIWRVKYPNPSLKSKLKWHLITLLLTGVRFGNIFTTKNKNEALTESTGRFVGWVSLLSRKPKIV
jgi:glycosyltransferase involved in cell wall biosynthesis